MKRGDIVLVRIPFVDGGSKRRPALIVQDDRNNRRLETTIVAASTSNLRNVSQPTQLQIDPSTPEGQGSGLLLASAVKCENHFTVSVSAIQPIGSLDPVSMARVDDCLKVSLGLSGRK
ncbi:type II toxin-antitoxin system PemK/MazF family toxin [Tundrisphaera lichenicola]|uniref:type II toxin-antitoxin system PemK/MazF family toxin n=1 Tax=Tundrisphaera lichenicola TaxID=2029860 RepID=UPI003EBCE83E